ncbi:MAG: Asp-tRNA(Asn)/Glu-tRNA(Gln) amidotransferase subunit GatC [Oscillospiraceae bacterium]|nr:Asp-tRNA(Asn)/Glu-tRNA(Gln) amidotransferase subunit GatC [Oscillospiraceae bacterium]MCR5305809.1 Asp-tRNA(Asn)/Glu-tRNA(Gln) amidotransferase subunit GatC [Oscillospiraceae bacterium]
MQLDQQTLDTLAWLSRLDIPENETEALSESIAEMLTFFQQLSALDTEGVEPTAHIAPLENVLREDIPAAERLDRETLLSGTESEDGLITLPRVIG